MSVFPIRIPQQGGTILCLYSQEQLDAYNHEQQYGSEAPVDFPTDAYEDDCQSYANRQGWTN